ncbi:MAG: hypothetical protein IKT07_04780 [Oscillospiraceae bacterium]|nr:hypothetical protein [Oscillospiraceae bacterium]
MHRNMERTVEQKYPHAFHSDRPKHDLPDDFVIRHPKMSLGQRAKIFSPFSALRGFEEAIDSKLETYVRKIELCEEDQEKVNQVLLELVELMKNGRQSGHRPVVTVAFYIPCSDENNEAYGLRGTYETLTGTVRKIDPVSRKIIQVSESIIEFSDILEIGLATQTEEGG